MPVGATLGTLEVLGALGLILPAVLGIAPGTVKSRLSRARASLQAALAEVHHE